MITVASLRTGAQALAQQQIDANETERAAAIAPYQRKLQAADALDLAGFADEATAMREPAQATIDAANAVYDKAAATLAELHGQIDDMDDAAVWVVVISTHSHPHQGIPDTLSNSRPQTRTGPCSCPSHSAG